MFFWEFALESSVLVLMILGIRKIFMGKIRYAGIYALWLLVLLRFLIPVNFFSSPLSVGGIIPEAPAESIGGFGGGAPDGDSQVEWRVSGGDGALSSPQTEAAQQGAFSGGEETYGAGVQEILSGGWLLVSGALLLWFVLSNVSLMRRLKKNRVPYGKRDTVSVYLAPDVKTPCLYGFFRPAIYLPQGLIEGESGQDADREDIEQMITHEYVHYRHGDHIWAIFRVLLVSVYWFHPFLWLAVSRSKKDAELFCDETVIRLLGEKKRFSYGRMLVRLAGKPDWGEFRYPIMAMSRRGREMEKRIRAISRRKSYSRWVAIPLALLVLLAAGITCSTQSAPAAVEEETAGAENTADAGETVGAEGKTDSGDGAARGAQAEEPQKVSYVFEDTAAVEAAFEKYIDIFTRAVNTGNTDEMYLALAEDSEIYAQQCALVKNYYKRGIREAAETCSITSLTAVGKEQVAITSREKIKVYYADGKSKVIRQKYNYTCERIDGKWIITAMDEIAR